eukprot:358946-Chlamydomonas_euryale.AAC.1
MVRSQAAEKTWLARMAARQAHARASSQCNKSPRPSPPASHMPAQPRSPTATQHDPASPSPRRASHTFRAPTPPLPMPLDQLTRGGMRRPTCGKQ